MVVSPVVVLPHVDRRQLERRPVERSLRDLGQPDRVGQRELDAGPAARDAGSRARSGSAPPSAGDQLACSIAAGTCPPRDRTSAPPRRRTDRSSGTRPCLRRARSPAGRRAVGARHGAAGPQAPSPDYPRHVGEQERKRSDVTMQRRCHGDDAITRLRGLGRPRQRGYRSCSRRSAMVPCNSAIWSSSVSWKTCGAKLNSGKCLHSTTA